MTHLPVSQLHDLCHHSTWPLNGNHFINIKIIEEAIDLDFLFPARERCALRESQFR